MKSPAGAAFPRSRCHRRLLGGARGYSKFALETALGLLGMAIFIVATIALAAGVTYAIVRISPTKRRSKAGEAKPS
jgi:hypothetical protein